MLLKVSYLVFAIKRHILCYSRPENKHLQMLSYCFQTIKSLAYEVFLTKTLKFGSFLADFIATKSLISLAKNVYLLKPAWMCYNYLNLLFESLFNAKVKYKFII
jgi:hypothetical protein